ncbi:hypothetical protein P7C73_g5857, partial [Tremellales sp. Uapishka_1]
MSSREHEIEVHLYEPEYSDTVPYRVSISTSTTTQHVIDKVLLEIGDDRKAKQELGGEWMGPTTGARWSLREMREMEDGTWWTEDEVRDFKDPLLKSSQVLPVPKITSYTLLPSNTPKVSVILTLPTTTASNPLTVNLPITRSTTVSSLLDRLQLELGLPRSTSDLLGGGNSASRSRSGSRSSKRWSGVDAGPKADDDVRWKVSLVDVVRMGDLVWHCTSNGRDHVFKIELDDSWLYEKARLPSGTTLSDELGSQVHQKDLSDELVEGDNTLKASTSTPIMASPAPSMTQQSTPNMNRLSGLFHGWLDTNKHPAPPPSPQLSTIMTSPVFNLGSPNPGDRRRRTGRTLSVSGPLEADKDGGTVDRQTRASTGDDTAEVDIAPGEWNQFLDDLNLQGSKRNAMSSLSPSRKSYLLQQNRLSSFPRSPPTPSVTSPQPQSVISLSTGTSAGLARLLPQLTGGSSSSSKEREGVGWTKRFSIASLGSWSDVGDGSSAGGQTPRAESSASDKGLGESKSLERQVTGGLWGWWAGTAKYEEGSAGSFIEALNDSKRSPSSLIKHLLSLRVTLSTAKLSFIDDFLQLPGLESLQTIMARLSRQPRQLDDLDEQILAECIKCLRVLMNTDNGFNRVLDRPLLVSLVTFTLHTPSHRLRCQVADLLAALCLLSSVEGGKLILDALQDSHVVFQENHRFEWLLQSLHQDGEGGAVDGVHWEWRIAVLSLINALIDSQEELEVRCELREELRRRGLNGVLEEMRLRSPPEHFLTQAEIYQEEKEEDLAELRNLNLNEAEYGILGAVFSSLGKTTKDHEGVLPFLVELLSGCSNFLDKDLDSELKVNLMIVLAKFSEHVLDITDLYSAKTEDWEIAVEKFAADIRQIFPDLAEVARSIGESRSETSVLNSFVDEVDRLHLKAKELQVENTDLKDRLETSRAEEIVWKGLNASEDGEAHEHHGLVHGLVQKEKELQRLMAVHGATEGGHDALRETDHREREKLRFAALLEENANLKQKVSETDLTSVQHRKDIQYLERALDSVRSRMQSTQADIIEQPPLERIDAETIATQAIASWVKQEEMIIALRKKIEVLQTPYPGAPPVRGDDSNAPSNSISRSPPPPPPPPPTPPLSLAPATLQ